MAPAATASLPEWKKIQEGFADKGLQHVFLELLGWGLGNAKVLPCEIDGQTFTPTVVADLKGYRVFLIETSPLPSPKLQARIDGALALQAPERITIFSDGSSMQWRWPHQTPSGGVSYESLTISASRMPSFLAQRLVGLKFSAKDFAAGVSLVDVRDRVRGRFDGAKVTKKFFDEFRKHHQHLASSIEGIELEEDRSAYATLLMNRLMLLYFLQKREFLNDDPFYLENCLKQVQQSRGENKFYSFYRDLLLPMFFDRLAAFAPKELEPDVARIIGDIPYINGGIYEPSALEKEFGPALNVPDEIFEIVLNFFGKFNWHLDTRPSGSENEINPEVIGYIFEQYINYTAGGKKDNGAYYTKEDVTGYMVGATLVPRILDYLVELKIPFLDLVVADPRRYIHADMLHGYDPVAQSWLSIPDRLEEVWADDPVHWHELDEADHDSDINLAGESWVETFYRRERVETLVEQLEGGLIGGVNELITHNLNSRLLLTDAIDRIERVDQARDLWANVTSLSVLDPTCGSGAFLFAAMEALEDVYHHLIDVMRTEGAEDGMARVVVDEIDRHPNDRYFVRKSIALNNLYGTDLMPDAIETAQLRIFLALVSCLETKTEIEPLPDLNFNLKCGNLVVGLNGLEDLDRFGADLLIQAALAELAPEIETYRRNFEKFVELSKQGDSSAANSEKAMLLALAEKLRGKTDRAFEDLAGVEQEAASDWLEKYRPFHWFIEFPQVMQRGGFDVIIGNPPYIARSSLSSGERRLIASYQTSDCPDFYAVCFERSLKLLDSHSGRHALIVMLNLAFSDDFGPLRDAITQNSQHEWWSTYGKRPDALFSGVQVRNTIVVLARNGDIRGEFAAKHQLFTKASRGWLFQAIEYRELVRGPRRSVVRAGVASPLVEACTARPPVGGPPIEAGLYLKPTGQYWFPVLLSAPPVLGRDGSYLHEIDPGVKRVELREGEEAETVGAALAGKLGYLCWSATGDDFHVNARETDLVRRLLLAVSGLDGLRELARNVWAEGFERSFVSENKGGYVNIRWSAARSSTDEFDRELLRLAGFADYWRPLNVWYRQSMLAERTNTNSRELTQEERNRIFGS